MHDFRKVQTLNSLKGKVAIVTGGSRGIGRAIVTMLAQNGCHVTFNYHSQEEKAKSLEKDLQKYKIKCVASKIDIKDFEKVKEWTEKTKETLGRLDILVNNAGIVIDKALMLMAKEDWREVIETNLTGVFNATRAAIVTFMKQKSGTIVNISSASGIIGLPRQVNYSASKGGINAFTKSLAKEVAAYGIRVNAIAPGYIDTEILSGMSEELKTKILKSIPLGRMGQTDEIARCVKFLLSEEAQYITGQIIKVDGGLAMR